MIEPETKRAPRLLEVLFSFRVGGSELLGLEVARHMIGRGIDVFCTALDGMDGPLRSQCEDMGCKVVDLGLPRSGLFARNGLSLDLSRRIRALDLDSVHLQHFLGLNKLGIPARIAGVRRIIVTEHSVSDIDQSAAGRFRARLNWRLAEAITVVHSGIAEYLVESIGVDQARIKTVPIGVEPRIWHAADRAACREMLGVVGKFVFVFAGRFAPVKNLPALVSTFLEFAEKSSVAATLLLVGDGEDAASCKRIAKASRLGDSVHFLGEQRDIRPYLSAADAFVMNSLSEGTPRALLEAMCMGLPAIAPAVGGIPAILDGRGWVTKPGDSDSLKSAFWEVISLPGVAAAFGLASQQYVHQHFSMQESLASYETLLRQS